MLPVLSKFIQEDFLAPPNTCKREYTGGEYLEVTRTSIGGKYFHTVFYIFEKNCPSLLRYCLFEI